MLNDIKNRIRSLRNSEKICRWLWLVKKERYHFRPNSYNAGKALHDPKCYVNLKVEQLDLDQHKSSSLNRINK